MRNNKKKEVEVSVKEQYVSAKVFFLQNNCMQIKTLCCSNCQKKELLLLMHVCDV